MVVSIPVKTMTSYVVLIASPRGLAGDGLKAALSRRCSMAAERSVAGAGMSEKGTEQATAQRKKKAREEGDSVHSRELLSAVAMLGGVLIAGRGVGRHLCVPGRGYTRTA